MQRRGFHHKPVSCSDLWRISCLFRSSHVLAIVEEILPFQSHETFNLLVEANCNLNLIWCHCYHLVAKSPRHARTDLHPSLCNCLCAAAIQGDWFSRLTLRIYSAASGLRDQRLDSRGIDASRLFGAEVIIAIVLIHSSVAGSVFKLVCSNLDRHTLFL